MKVPDCVTIVFDHCYCCEIRTRGIAPTHTHTVTNIIITTFTAKVKGIAKSVHQRQSHTPHEHRPAVVGVGPQGHSDGMARPLSNV